jgi:hypothetical protein
MEKIIRRELVRKLRNVNLESFIYLINLIDGGTDEAIKEIFGPLRGGETFEKIKLMLSYISTNSDVTNVEDCAKLSLFDWVKNV